MKKKQNLWITIGVVAFVLLAAGLMALYFGTRQAPVDGQKHFTFSVTHADGTVKTFQYTTEDQYLGAFLMGQGIIEGQQEEYGLTVYVADGERADWQDGVYWAIYENGAYATAGIDKILIQDGGNYGLVYESF